MPDFYAIRHRPTGHFLPAWARKRGHTNAEPSPVLPPRLFHRRQDAKAALDWWVQGAWRCIDWEDGEIAVRKVVSRDERDMEIVTLAFSVENAIPYRKIMRK